MAIITEDYVSFETAKLLKEKGFMDGAMVKFFASGYDKNGYILSIDETELDDFPRPTLQMAIKWLRKVHNIACFASPAKEKGFHTNKWNSYADKLSDNWPKDSLWFVETSNSYEQACEAAIKYCLEHLI